MTPDAGAAVAARPVPPPPVLGTTVSRGRRYRNRLATLLIWLAVPVALVPLGIVLLYVFRKGSAIIDLPFLVEDIPVSPRVRAPGMGPAIAGTLLITLGAATMAIPLGVMAAVYINEYGRGSRPARAVRFLSDVMAGVPSIVMGLFIYAVWVIRYGQSGFAGALALGALMLPIVIRSTEGMLQLVPEELREGSAALGATRSRTIVSVVLPAALPGITSGALLAIARAAGETAPLLFTIGAARALNLSLFEGVNTALSTQIFANAQSPFIPAQDRAWGAALTLIVLVLVLTVLGRVISSRFTRR